MYGEEGIRPLLTTMKNINKVTNYWTKFYTFPSIFWNVSPSDENIIKIINIGIISSILSIFTIHRSVCLFVNWIIYISFVSIGSEFLFYQWDSLILETTLLSSIYCYTGYDLLIKMFFYYIFFKINILNFIKKLSCEWTKGLSLHKHLYTQPIPRKDNLYIYHYKPLAIILNYYIMLHELMIPFFVLYNPSIAFLLITIYSTISALLNNIVIIYFIYMNIGALICDFNIFYNILDIGIDIIYPCLLFSLVYIYSSQNVFNNYYHININYDFFNSVNLNKKKLVFYADDKKILFHEKELFSHNYILWHLGNSGVLNPNINSWLNFFSQKLNRENQLIENNYIMAKNMTIYIYDLEPNTIDNIKNNKSWKVLNKKIYTKIKMEEH